MVFWALLLAHVIGDFPLQTDVIFRLKKKSVWGVVPHVIICTFVNIVALWPFLKLVQVWYAILFLALIHIILDRGKILLSSWLAKDNFLQFVIDQGLHILSIFFAAAFLAPYLSDSTINFTGLYANPELLIKLTMVIFAAFGGTPIVYYVQKHFTPHTNNPTESDSSYPYPTFIKRIPGLFERFSSTLGILLGGFWLVLTVASFLPRILLNWREKDRNSTLIAALAGLLVSLFSGVIALWAL